MMDRHRNGYEPERPRGSRSGRHAPALLLAIAALAASFSCTPSEVLRQLAPVSAAGILQPCLAEAALLTAGASPTIIPGALVGLTDTASAAPGGGDEGLGGTGIVGTITAFGSICVNGIEVHFGADTPIERQGMRITRALLERGQLVEVGATRGRYEVAAHRILIRIPVAGPIERVDLASGEIEVLGQRILVGAEPVAGLGIGDLAPGAGVRVSGLRRPDGVVVASNVSGGPIDRGWLEGRVNDAGPESFSIGGLRLKVPEHAYPPTDGQRVVVQGSPEDGGLVAYHIELDPGLEFERFGVVSMEGYLRTRSRERGFWLGGLQLWADDLPQDVGADALVRIHGRVEGGRWIKPDRIDFEERGGGARRWIPIPRRR